jgi:methanogenic corrinoid protein MtbC1
MDADRHGIDVATEQAEPTSNARLSIGALSRATSIPVETLRTWEARYGFPVPERKPSGHRVYAVSNVPRLRRVAEALARGHRAGEVVPASEQDLANLLRLSPAPLPAIVPDTQAPAEVGDVLALVEAFDAEGLTRRLLADWSRLGPLEFLRARVAPLVRAVGEAWARGRLEVRHEHFLSERLADILRMVRLPFEERARGPLVILATLPGESHGLGLQMAALILAVNGCRIVYLGTEVPVPQIATLAKDLSARAVALSVSKATRTGARGPIRRLRDLLPRRLALLVGGDGGWRIPGVELIQDLPGLDAWAQRVTPAA